MSLRNGMPLHVFVEDRPAPEWVKLSASYTSYVDTIAKRKDIRVRIAPADKEADKSMADQYGLYRTDTGAIEINGPKFLPKGPKRKGYDLDPWYPMDREEMASLHGVIVHECGHADHTIWPDEIMKRIKGGEKIGSNLGQWAMLLEESRMESKVIQGRPNLRRWIRACFKLTFDDAKDSLAKDGTSPNYAAQLAVLTVARADAGIIDDDEIVGLEDMIIDSMGEDKYFAMRDVWMDCHKLDDDDADGMLDCARRIMEILGEDPDGAGYGSGGEGEGDGEGEDAIAKAAGKLSGEISDGAAQQIKKHKLPMKEDAIGQASRDAAKQTMEKGNHGYSAHGDMAVSTRHPRFDERALAAKLTRALQSARFRERGKVIIPSEMPPGHLKMRDAMAADAMKSMGREPDTFPWRKTKRTVTEMPPIKVGVCTDISGSMSHFAGPLSSITWAFSRAVASCGGRFASVVFGKDVYPLVRPGEVPPMVTDFEPHAGQEAFEKAALALNGMLELSVGGNGARLMIVVSDGHYVAPGELERGQAIVDFLAKSGVRMLQITPEDCPYRMDHIVYQEIRKAEDTPDAVSKALLQLVRES